MMILFDTDLRKDFVDDVKDEVYEQLKLMSPVELEHWNQTFGTNHRNQLAVVIASFIWDRYKIDLAFDYWKQKCRI